MDYSAVDLDDVGRLNPLRMSSKQSSCDPEVPSDSNPRESKVGQPSSSTVKRVLKFDSESDVIFEKHSREELSEWYRYWRERKIRVYGDSRKGYGSGSGKRKSPKWPVDWNRADERKLL